MNKITATIKNPLGGIRAIIDDKEYQISNDSLKWLKGEPIWVKEGGSGKLEAGTKILAQNSDTYAILPTDLYMGIYSRFRKEEAIYGYINDNKEFVINKD